MKHIFFTAVLILLSLLAMAQQGLSTYQGASPTTTPVGGLPSGTTITGKTWQWITEKMAAPVSPAITPVENGGTGLSTLPAGVLKSNGTTISAAVAGTDYTSPSSNNLWTGNNSFDDSKFRLFNSGDATRIGTFSLGNVSTGANRTLAFPNTSGTIVVGVGSTNALAYWSAGSTLANTSNIATDGSRITIGGTTPSNSNLITVSSGFNPTSGSTSLWSFVAKNTWNTSGTYSGEGGGFLYNPIRTSTNGLTEYAMLLHGGQSLFATSSGTDVVANQTRVDIRGLSSGAILRLASHLNVEQFVFRNSGVFEVGGSAGTTGYFLTANTSGAPTWTDPQSLPYWRIGGNNLVSNEAIGSLNNFDVIIKRNNINRALFDDTDIRLYDATSLTRLFIGPGATFLYGGTGTAAFYSNQISGSYVVAMDNNTIGSEGHAIVKLDATPGTRGIRIDSFNPSDAGSSPTEGGDVNITSGGSSDGGVCGDIVLQSGSSTDSSSAGGGINLTTGTGSTAGNITLTLNGGDLIFTITRTNCTGAPSGAVYNDSGTLKICP